MNHTAWLPDCPQLSRKSISRVPGEIVRDRPPCFAQVCHRSSGQNVAQVDLRRQ